METDCQIQLRQIYKAVMPDPTDCGGELYRFTAAVGEPQFDMFRTGPYQTLDILTVITTNNAIIISGKLNIYDKPQWIIDFLIRINTFGFLYSRSSVR